MFSLLEPSGIKMPSIVHHCCLPFHRRPVFAFASVFVVVFCCCTLMLFPVAVLQDGLGIAGCILVVMGGCVRLHFLAVFMDVSELVTVVMAG